MNVFSTPKGTFHVYFIDAVQIQRVHTCLVVSVCCCTGSPYELKRCYFSYFHFAEDLGDLLGYENVKSLGHDSNKPLPSDSLLCAK